ncbi:MAG: CRISPR-associated protein Csx3 [Anaerolineae bacterium]|nr:CRISPR-associated protein Csx3 [Anaerolineae bacterium]
MEFYNPLPAVAIGGPPHSGKSVLAYSLTRALRDRAVPHYLLRAYPPDGEGDWFLEGEPDLVRHLRVKGAVSGRWLHMLRQDIARRHLPLIVDLGGLPTPEQESILDDCTHGILLTPSEGARREWTDRFATHGLVLLADLRSDLRGENTLEGTEPVIRGVLAGLERGQMASGPAFDALVERLAALFGPFAADLYRRHMAAAPAELVVDLERLARQMGREPTEWRPDDLPAVLDYLPAGEPLALYGRGPNWLYSAVAVHALPAPFYLFDARLGWAAPPTLSIGTPPTGPLRVEERRGEGTPVARMEFFLPEAYLDITEVEGMSVPAPSPEGLILSGKLPLWLWAGLARLYAPRTSWLAVVQPQLTAQDAGWAVVVHSRAMPPIGSVIGL